MLYDKTILTLKFFYIFLFLVCESLCILFAITLQKLFPCKVYKRDGPRRHEFCRHLGLSSFVAMCRYDYKQA